MRIIYNIVLDYPVEPPAINTVIPVIVAVTAGRVILSADIVNFISIYRDIICA